jgi:transcriptional regulator with XRE-family HTH domain
MSEDEIEDTSVSKYYQVIGERIALRRKAIKMRQEDLAKLIGLSRVSISNIETGRQCPPIHTLYKISEVLKTDIHDILPRDIREIDEEIARVAIYNLADTIGLNPVEHEQELREMIERINRLKEERKND